MAKQKLKLKANATSAVTVSCAAVKATSNVTNVILSFKHGKGTFDSTAVIPQDGAVILGVKCIDTAAAADTASTSPPTDPAKPMAPAPTPRMDVTLNVDGAPTTPPPVDIEYTT